MIPLLQALLAFLLPCFVIWKKRKSNPLKHPQLYSVGSFACCAWGIIAELTTIKSRFLAGDLAGIADTMDAVIALSVAMTIVTVILNLIALSYPTDNE